MDINELKTDETRAAGVWMKYDDAEFLIAYVENKAYKRALTRAIRKIAPAELKRKPELGEAAVAEAMGETILLDWRNVKAGDAPFPCTPANKRTLLSIPEFRDWLATQCNDAANFRAEAMAEDASDLKSGPEMVS